MLPALIITLIVAAGAALDWGFEDTYNSADLTDGPNEGQYRHEAQRYAEAEGRNQGMIDANAGFEQLLLNGSYEEGKDLAYDRAWNIAIRTALNSVSRQWLADEPGTQWVELFR